ncbi:DUF5997 family protein [Corynebacterium ulceribovis]|uniref:DUF5997 family protein n=1 Tax=Corynebacterium ulceribovis TaxID=487732 RepID=UPI0003A6AD84|nr:DUF5997 family protein [Corynebacterium ulceribovis]
MKPLTAAKKLGIFLPATPAEFQESAISREQFQQLQTDPPEWLQTLRREGPHPRPVVAQKLGITITALKRNDMDKALTTAEINELLVEAPEWLAKARESMAQQRAEAQTDGAEATTQENSND